jgi:hypothetical protein
MACIREGPFSRIEKLQGSMSILIQLHGTSFHGGVSASVSANSIDLLHRNSRKEALKGVRGLPYAPVGVSWTYMEVTASQED